MADRQYILTVNAGSSSIKLSLYAKINGRLTRQLAGKVEHIGKSNALLIVKQNESEDQVDLHASGFSPAIKSLIKWLGNQDWFSKVYAIGHRIVHGMDHTKAAIITRELLNELNSFIDYDPDHLPSEIEIIKSLKSHYPDLLQIACFDTAFHTTMPDVAKTVAIPKKYYAQGIRRYGFHGISYSYLMEELKKQNTREAAGRVVLAHLGNGASLAAVKKGKCIDTSMGFTPAGGIVMSSRSGNLDPGVAWFLMSKGMDAKQFNNIINHQSGLLGLSGVSADMQQLLLQEKNNPDAALAINIFCYQIKKYIGAYTAALGGLDALVFSGGIGENAEQIRARVCEGLQYSGIVLDKKKNAAHQLRVSSDESRVKVYVIPANEEWMIAQETLYLYNKHTPK